MPEQDHHLVELFNGMDRNAFVDKEGGDEIKTDDPGLLPVLDVQGSLDNMGDDAGLYREIMAMFAECAPEVVYDLLIALQAGDPAQAEFYSHNLKGMSANVGARRLAELARIIHNSVRSTGQGDLDLWQARLRDEFETVMAAITAACKSL